MWFIGVEVEQETNAPPPKKNPGSAPGSGFLESLGPSVIFKHQEDILELPVWNTSSESQ